MPDFTNFSKVGIDGTELAAAAPSIIATWTNTASAAAGLVDVYVTYIELPTP